MTAEQIEELLNAQRAYFKSGATLGYGFRMDALGRLYDALVKREGDIADAVKADLGKSAYETYMCETGQVKSEISYLKKHLKSMMKPVKVHTPFSQYPSKGFRVPNPYGNVLIMSPWNYPVLLTLEPLTNAIAAGNTAIVKPSAYSPSVSAVIADILGGIFDERYVAVVTGGRSENAALLERRFDMVFFTGSTNVGREVLRHTAEHLTPVVLELGGKSPCIVDSSAKLPLAARRIVFGKFLNCGQTCVAPDYVLCDERIKDDLVSAICEQITAQFGEHPLERGDYGKIVSEKHFDRVLSLIDESKVVRGGRYDRQALRIEPTVMDGVTWDDAVMGEEIFGPVLPVLTYSDFEEVYSSLADRPSPLALYLFSSDKSHMDGVATRIRYGGGCFNDTIIHLATSELPFGGVGDSGMGAYHGKVGFETFSHVKSILSKSTRIDMGMRYQPYKKGTFSEKMLRSVLK